jgi:hypothetical protein
MANAGMEEQSSYDYGVWCYNRIGSAWFSHESILVLTAEYASLIAMEFGRNPIVNDEAAFDIYPPCALVFDVNQVYN